MTNKHFDEAKFAFPQYEILDLFNKSLKTNYEKRGILEQESAKLTALRDKLLPLLMNGQVEII